MSRLPLAFALVAFTAAAQSWSLDTQATELAVKTFKAGAAAALAHDHVMVASEFSGQASLDEAGSPQSLALELTVPVKALVVDEPEARRRYHLPNTPVKEDDRRKIREAMLGEGQLDAEKFPTIHFVVTRLYAEENGQLQCLGNLTLHGVTKELLFPVQVKVWEGERAVGDARVRFKTSDFGIEPYSAALGLVRNKDEVELVVHVVLKRS